MGCEEVREQLAEHLLGTLDPDTDAAIRRHLRGCASCRAELAALEDGVSTLAHAAHEVEPPPDLRDRVLGALAEEWEEVPSLAEERHRRRPWLARVAWAAAAVVVLAATLSWGVVAQRRADRYEAAANTYTGFLDSLGGEAVRFGNLEPTGQQEIRGSAVLYDSKVGQSWALVLVRAPGLKGEAGATLSSSTNGHTIDLPPLWFETGGEASTWLVTSSDLRPFDRVTITAPDGQTLATAVVANDAPSA
jgi:Putative zinc-finger